MRAAMLAERIKAARRHDLLLAALTGLLTALCAAVRPEEDWQRAVGYSAMTVNLSLMNAVVMPLAMAALASRL